MLSIEEIKKCIALADGFYSRTWVDDEHEIGIDGQGCIYSIERSNTWEYVMYPLLLQRVMEGINKSYEESEGCRYWIEQHLLEINVYDADDNTVCANWYYREFQGDIDQAKEQAIRYILENI